MDNYWKVIQFCNKVEMVHGGNKSEREGQLCLLIFFLLYIYLFYGDADCTRRVQTANCKAGFVFVYLYLEFCRLFLVSLLFPSAHIPHPFTLLQFLTAKQAATVGYLTPCFHMGLPSSMEAGREYFMRNEEKPCINGRHSCLIYVLEW